MNILSVKKEPFNTNSTPIGRFLHDQQKLDLELNLNRLTDVDFLKLSFTFLVNIFFSIMVLTGRALFVPMNAYLSYHVTISRPKISEFTLFLLYIVPFGTKMGNQSLT